MLGIVVLVAIHHRLQLLVIVGLAVEIDVVLGRERLPETRARGVGLVAARSQQNHHRNDQYRYEASSPVQCFLSLLGT